MNDLAWQFSESLAGAIEKTAAGVVPRSLPNNRPERIAHALKRWQERPGAPGASFIAFLSP